MQSSQSQAPGAVGVLRVRGTETIFKASFLCSLTNIFRAHNSLHISVSVSRTQDVIYQRASSWPQVVIMC